MKKNKNIKKLAALLPPVYEAAASGFTIGEDGKPVPHVYNVQINHERRLNKILKTHGPDGVKAYLDMINQLQKERNERIQERMVAEELERNRNSAVSGGVDTPGDTESDVTDPILGEVPLEGISGAGQGNGEEVTVRMA